MTPEIESAAVRGEAAATVLREYYAEMVRRYHGRVATSAEVDAAMAEEPSDDLAPPDGVFLLARDGGRVVGCVGLRCGPAPYAELTRLFVIEAERGRGIAATLLGAAEHAAREANAAIIRLDTRDDLVEARSLYAKHGYRSTPAYNEAPYAQHWFAKELSSVD